MKALFGLPFAIIFWIAGPVTYILLIVDTWQTRSSTLLKIVISLTLDAFMAAIWPITWLIWLFQYAIAKSYTTPLTTVLGF